MQQVEVPPVELSVIIPSHNREATLRRLLDSLVRQTHPAHDFEVIIADDASTDGTAEMLDSLDTPFTLRPLRLTHRGEWAASNAGIEAAAGRICLLLDDDVVASPDLVAAHVAAHRQSPRIFAMGRLIQEPPPDNDWYTRAYAQAWNQQFLDLEHRAPKWRECYSGNLSVPREALLEIGGFSVDPLADGDSELAYRLCGHGYRFQYAPDAVGTHFDNKTRARLLAAAARHGAAGVRWADRDPAMMPDLLGSFGEGSPREIALRRLMLALRVPPEPLARLGPVFPGRHARELWFQFVSKLAFWRGVRKSVTRPRWNSLTHGVPVLLYHAFTDSGEEDRYIVSKRSFALQMLLLKALRYRVIPFEELAQGLREHRLPPPRSVVITIDDGYEDNLRVAYPVLRRRGYPATIFVVSQRIGKHNDWSSGPPMRGRSLLSHDEALRLRDGSIQLGAHTRNHPRLSKVSDEEIQPEVEGSCHDLEQELGTNVKTFAYPFGDFDYRSTTAVDAAGLLGAGTTEPLLVHPDADPTAVPRIEIKGSDSMVRFLTKLWFGVR